MVVEVGATAAEPLEVAVSLPMPWSIETEAAPVVFHKSVLEVLITIVDGDAENELIVGSSALGFTLLEIEEDAEVPTAFVAVMVKV